MRATEFAHEFAYTATNGTTLVAFLTFFGLLELATVERLVGLWLLAVAIPGTIRYLMLLLDARARDRNSKPPGIEMFSWFGSAWSLVPIIHLLVLVYGTYLLGSLLPDAVAYAFLLLFTLLLPASLAVLAVSRTPLECARPGALAALIRRCGPAYAIVPGYIVVGYLVIVGMHQVPIPILIVELATLYLVFAGFAVTGALIRPLDLYSEVGLPESLLPAADAGAAKLERDRKAVLDHAYGMISRGNREGGIRHIRSRLNEDPDPGTAWPWFVDRMLDWESPQAGLVVAQDYLGRLLRAGDAVTAMKLLLRCRLLNDAFLPLPEDRELAHAAAVRYQHDELAALLE